MEKVKRLLGDEQVAGDLRSTTDKWSTEPPFVGPDQEEKNWQTKLRNNYDFSAQVSGGFELSMWGGRVEKKRIALNNKPTLRAARTANVNTNRDQQLEFMYSPSNGSDSVELRESES